MDKAHLFYNYLKYSALSKNEHSFHSPFVFELYNDVFKNDSLFYAYRTVEDIRDSLLSDPRMITVTDLGAGSGNGLKKERKVSKIAETAAKEKKYAQLLFRFVDHFQSENILELGTSLGLGTMYLAIARSKSTVFTMEGCSETQKIAIDNFQKAELENIRPILGNFDTELPKFLATISKLDVVYFDGNHRKEATLNYFRQCLEKADNNSIFVFDDIYWSKEMTQAWEEIKAHPKVTVTLDVFQMGFVFFRTEQAKQHFILKY